MLPSASISVHNVVRIEADEARPLGPGLGYSRHLRIIDTRGHATELILYAAAASDMALPCTCATITTADMVVGAYSKDAAHVTDN